MRCASPPESVGARAVEREIPQADVLEEAEPRLDLRRHVARDLALARLELQPLEVRAATAATDRAVSSRDRLAVEPHGAAPPASAAGPSHAAQASAPSASTSVHSRFLAALLLVEPRELDAGAEALGAPAVACELYENKRGSSGSKLRLHDGHARSVEKSSPSAAADLEHAHHVAAELDGARERVLELAARRRLHLELRDGQLDVVLLEPARAAATPRSASVCRRRAASRSRDFAAHSASSV